MSLAIIAVFVLLTLDGNSQSIVLVNGQATEVVLNGEDIKTIVRQNIADYMKDYGQSVDKDFIKTELKIDSNQDKSKGSEKVIKTSDRTKAAHHYVVLASDRPPLASELK